MHHLNIKQPLGRFLLLGACLLAAGAVPSSALADCEAGENAAFTLLVDASSSCAALSSNMTGCETDATGRCVIQNPTPGGVPIVVQVTPSNAVGSVPVPPNLISWEVQSGPQFLTGQEIDFVISLGATGGGTCGTSYTPGKSFDFGLGFKKSNGTYQKVNGLFFCSDFLAPLPSLPRLLLKKTVMLAGGTCGNDLVAGDDVESLTLKVGMQVQYCFLVENVGSGDATAVTLSDPGVLTQVIGNLASGESTLITSDPVTISSQGQAVNSADVTGASVTGTVVPTATDTATVNAQLSLETCPPDYQGAVDDITTGQGEDGFKYAALLDPLNPERISVCVPSNVDSNTACIDECILKDECKDPTGPLYDAAVCEPPTGSKCVESGNWAVGPDQFNCQPPNGEMPYCWEVIQDRAPPNCEYKPVEPLKSLDINIQQFHDNPFCYLSCADVSELKSCNYICF